MDSQGGIHQWQWNDTDAWVGGVGGGVIWNEMDWWDQSMLEYHEVLFF